MRDRILSHPGKMVSIINVRALVHSHLPFWTFMVFRPKVFDAKMATTEHAFSICANRNIVAAFNVTVPHTHGYGCAQQGRKKSWEF